ncbi:hypothetical protein GOODEAATRI_021205 [Goodea atripinnis]|uniref:Secreted protein n=1 Tax=Goodea atripinnis TaxID=208336 RepID=A0ABV0NWI0_9TELE
MYIFSILSGLLSWSCILQHTAWTDKLWKFKDFWCRGLSAYLEHQTVLSFGHDAHLFKLLNVCKAQGHTGGVGHRLTDVGSMDQIPQVLHPERGDPLACGEAQGVHHIGLTFKRFYMFYVS